MKRKTTKEILVESFRELAQKKAVDKITVQDIVQNCDYSPATFYRHFTDKYALISFDYTNKMQSIVEPLCTDSWGEVIKKGIEFFSVDMKYVRNLLKNTSGVDSFMDCMMHVNVELLSRSIMNKKKKRNL